MISDSENITQKWLDNDYYVLTLGFNYQNAKTTFNAGGLLSNYVGNHFGRLIWGQTLGSISPKHFYENQGTKNERSLFTKVNQSITNSLSGFADLQIRSIDYRVSGLVAGPSSFSVDDNFLF